MAVLPGHLLCQRQKPTSIYMKTMTYTFKLLMSFRLLKPLTAER